MGGIVGSKTGAVKQAHARPSPVRLSLPMRAPEDVIPHLGKGALHWKEGRSAKLLAEQWFAARNIPKSVRAVIGRAPEFAGATMLEGWLERATHLPWGTGNPSQTDLLALLRLTTGELAVLGIEAKVDETLGPLIGEWLAEGGDNRATRLAGLCRLFGLDPSAVHCMRYQVLHRVAASVLEAQRFGCRTAMVLVQSWCPQRTGLDAFQRFARFLGHDFEPNEISDAFEVAGVRLRIGWVAEQTA